MSLGAEVVMGGLMADLKPFRGNPDGLTVTENAPGIGKRLRAGTKFPHELYNQQPTG